MTPEERREAEREIDLWDVVKPEHKLPGPAAVISVCVIAVLSAFGTGVCLWLIFRCLSKP